MTTNVSRLKMVKNFFDLKVWQDSHKLELEIYRLTKEFPKEELFGLTSQTRRSSSSISANIAEGFGRFHYKDRIRFYQQARGSATEVQNHLLLIKDLGYLPEEQTNKLFEESTIIIKELNGLINSANRQIL